MASFVPFDVGVGLIDKTQVNAILSQSGLGYGSSTMVAAVAHAGGTQALGTALTACMNNVSVCATTGDSVCMPSAIGGQSLYVMNAGAATCNVFSSNTTPTDTINGTIGTTAYTIAAGKLTEWICIVPGAWRVILSA